jgi:3-dehydroquinate synthase
VIQCSIQVGWQLRVFFTENVFAPDNPVLRDALADTGSRKALVVLEDSLAQALPGLDQQIENYFSVHAEKVRLVHPPLFTAAGEERR